MCTTAIFHPACSVETGQQISSLPWSQVPVLQLTCWLEAKTQWLLSRNYMMIMIMMIMIMIMMMILYFAQFSAEESWVEVALLSFFLKFTVHELLSPVNLFGIPFKGHQLRYKDLDPKDLPDTEHWKWFADRMNWMDSTEVLCVHIYI